MPVSRCPIPLGVQTPHIFRQEISIHSKIDLYVEGSCAYRFVLFSLIFTLPVTKILLCKVGTYFPLDSRHSVARDIMNINLFLLITYYHAYKTLLRNGFAHRSLICCTAYGKLRSGPAHTVRLVRLWPHQLSVPKWACLICGRV